MNIKAVSLTSTMLGASVFSREFIQEALNLTPCKKSQNHCQIMLPKSHLKCAYLIKGRDIILGRILGFVSFPHLTFQLNQHDYRK